MAEKTVEISVDFRFAPARFVQVTHGPEGNCAHPEDCELCAAIDEAYE